MKDKELNSEIISEKVTDEKDFDANDTKIEIEASNIIVAAHKLALKNIGKISKFIFGKNGNFGNTIIDKDSTFGYIPNGTNIEFIYLVAKGGFLNSIEQGFTKFKTDGIFSRYLQAFTGESNPNFDPKNLLIGTFSDKNNIYYVCPYRYSIGAKKEPSAGYPGKIRSLYINKSFQSSNGNTSQQSSQQNNQQSGQQNTPGQTSSVPSGVAGMQLASTNPKIKFNKPIVNESDRIYIEKMIFEKIINVEKNK